MDAPQTQPQTQPSTRRPTPHDRLFKIVFEQLAYSGEFLSQMLPADLRTDLRLDNLASRRHEFVDTELASKLSDLLFSAPVANSEHQVYLLIEHQSQPDKTMTVRIAGYKYGLWARELRTQNSDGQVSAVFGLIVNQGPKGWNAATELSELLRVPNWFRVKHTDALDKSSLVVIDLSTMSDQEILASNMSAAPKLALWLLKHVAADDDLLASLPTVAGLYEQVARDHAGSDMFAALVRYTMYGRKVSADALHRFFQQHVNPHASEVIMNAVEQLLQQGRKEGRKDGRKEGRAQGKQESLLRLLEKRFDEVPKWARDRVQAATLSALDRWTIAVLDAKRIEDVFVMDA